MSTFSSSRAADNSYKMEQYEVLQGVTFLYNSISSPSANYPFSMPKKYIEINYCKEGRFDCEFSTNVVAYLSHGDLAINRYNNPACSCDFPMKWYKGITIVVDLHTVPTEIDLPDGTLLDISQLWEQLCPSKSNFFLYNNEVIQSIFEPLYEIPLEMRQQMHLLKWWELLIYLSSETVQQNNSCTHYLPYQQVGTIKEVEQYLIANIHQHITISELSTIFKTSPTTLKKRFNLVFGKPIFTYMREYRCHTAANLLLNKELSLSEVALQVGYINVSKFSSAFSELFGSSPSAYRQAHATSPKLSQ